MTLQAQYPPTAIPITYPNAPNSQLKLVNQYCGTAISVFFALFSCFLTVVHLSEALKSASAPFIVIKVTLAVASALHLYFFTEMIRLPEYLAGKPNLMKFWAPFANMVISLSIRLYLCGMGLVEDPLWDIFMEILMLAVCIGIYSQDDASESCFLCFKPWIYKKVQIDVIYVQAPTPIIPAQMPPSYPTVPFTYPGYNSPQQNIQTQKN